MNTVEAFFGSGNTDETQDLRSGTTIMYTKYNAILYTDRHTRAKLSS
jgi:hypothetical protein